jgi:hypothetical protein
MKLPANAGTYNRWAPAVLRNCLSYEYAPLDCPIRKCRRDGFCTGPLIARHDGTIRLAPADGAGAPPHATLVPACFVHVPDTVRARVTKACAANVNALLDAPGATVIETTRAIASRRWRRLRGFER